MAHFGLSSLWALLSITLVTLSPSSTLAQVLIPNNLPTCAAGCAQLQNAQSSCTPAGGAPVTNQQTYQSCFCQSALLVQLYSPSPITFCTQCSQADMATIQDWYKNFCKGGTGAAPAGGTSSVASNGQQPTSSRVQSFASVVPTSLTLGPSKTGLGTPADTYTKNDDSNKPW